MLNLKEPSDENQIECHETEPDPLTDRAMPEGNYPSFWDELQNLLFFFFHIRILRQVPKYLATGLLISGSSKCMKFWVETKQIKFSKLVFSQSSDFIMWIKIKDSKWKKKCFMILAQNGLYSIFDTKTQLKQNKIKETPLCLSLCSELTWK
jgi:hypothetical protein